MRPLQKLLSRSRLSRRLSGSATTVIRIIMAMRHYTMQAGNPQHFYHREGDTESLREPTATPSDK